MIQSQRTPTFGRDIGARVEFRSQQRRLCFELARGDQRFDSITHDLLSFVLCFGRQFSKVELLESLSQQLLFNPSQRRGFIGGLGRLVRFANGSSQTGSRTGYRFSGGSQHACKLDAFNGIGVKTAGIPHRNKRRIDLIKAMQDFGESNEIHL